MRIQAEKQREQMVQKVQEYLGQKTEDKVKENEELKNFENELKKTVNVSTEIMKAQCIKKIGQELYTKLYECMKALNKKGILNYDKSEEYLNLANNGEKRDIAYFIARIIEDENK